MNTYKNMIPVFAVHANDLDAFIPEFWAQESLAVLEENLVASNLVYRNFENTLAQMGDTVNCRRPNRFEPFRKSLTDDVTVQDATAVNVPVVLNQHVHTSFLIRDGEESKSMTDLIATYIEPAVKGMARWTDRMVLGQYGQFIANSTGKLQGLTASNSKSQLIDARKKAQNLLWPQDDMRPFIMNEDVEALMLNTDLFIAAEHVGDNGTALRTASLGKKFGFDMLMSQQMGNIPTGSTVTTGAVNNSAGYPVGTTSFVIDGFTGTLPVGAFITISESVSVLDGGWVSRIVSTTATLGNATGVVILDPIPFAVADNGVIKVYTPGTVNLSAGYAAGYAKAIVCGTFTVAPKVGQMVTFTNAAATANDPIYTVLGTDVSTTSITLDRPLEAAIANSDKVNIGPAGDYSFSFLRDAIALVIRPLAVPKSGTGARSANVNYNDLSMRATITYDGTKQGHLVTLDFLAGIKVLNKNFGMVMLG